jgi:hypothetical protein
MPPAQPPETPAGGKRPKFADLPIADLEKIARDMIKVDKRGKSGRQQCTVKLPYVGTVTVPCPE